jgi:hypothetical protein
MFWELDSLNLFVLEASDFSPSLGFSSGPSEKFKLKITRIRIIPEDREKSDALSDFFRKIAVVRAIYVC